MEKNYVLIGKNTSFLKGKTKLFGSEISFLYEKRHESDTKSAEKTTWFPDEAGKMV